MSTPIQIGYQPHQHQKLIHEKLKRFSVLVCHRRFGKTLLAINALIAAALRFKKHPNGRFIYVAPFLNWTLDKFVPTP